MIYICGDSFCVSDPAYGPSWVDLVAEKFAVRNLARVAATNLLIALQVQQAMANQAQFIIVNFTAVTRSEKRVGNDIVPFSYHTASAQTTGFNDRQLRILKEYYTEFFDLDLAIKQNQITIEHTLSALMLSGISFRFDQGGFEHPKFGTVGQGYFGQFEQYKSKINLWDHAVSRDYRPYYHITDAQVHRSVADYYSKEINQCL